MNYRSNNNSDAWYAADRDQFVNTPSHQVVAELSDSANRQGWSIEPAQVEEWEASVDLLKRDLSPTIGEGIKILLESLSDSGLSAISDVILEYNLRRRGLRIDAVLLAPGVIFVLEFKRSEIVAADRDQVTNYCVNLVEFHAETQRLVKSENFVIVPVLVLTRGELRKGQKLSEEFFEGPWSAVLKRPVEADSGTLADVIRRILGIRRSRYRADRSTWVGSLFSPSSTILDAAISLYGDHTVASIREHASSVERVEACVSEIVEIIRDAQAKKLNRIVFLSGAPGAGKTLVGLRLAFEPSLREDAVFVTGNAPLVEVLSKALSQSYRGLRAGRNKTLSGYPKAAESMVERNATFKIVKAHNFLGERGKHTSQADGRVVVFDEAQRTYKKGKQVLGRPLRDDEAFLILESLENSYGDGAVVVALIGQNQAINVGELGPAAWLEAAKRKGWEFAISDETFLLDEFASLASWRHHDLRLPLKIGHLSDSLRFYRNKSVEEWAGKVLGESCETAKNLARELEKAGVSFFVTRDLAKAKEWVRSQRVGDERIGIIASGQARRLAADGLFVELKPSIAEWMLAPSGDVRSSNALETVQNQYQVQGLELDYTVVCWDADLRREGDQWKAFKLNGSEWRRDSALAVARNSYRVLMTRARKGMVFFVPSGDLTGEDPTRDPRFYDDIVKFLGDCGVRSIDEIPA